MAAVRRKRRIGRDSEQGAIEHLFRELLPGLVRWTRRRLPPRARRRLDTSDLVQEALVGALQHLPELDQREAAVVRAYAQQSIRNRIRDELRRAGIGEVTGDARESTPDERPTPLEDAIENEDRNRFRRALARLERSDQELVVGRVELELSYEELAAATGRPSADAARVATRRAVLKLARHLGD